MVLGDGRHPASQIVTPRGANAQPVSLPAAHAAFLGTLVQRLSQDARVVGILAGGSYLSNSLDQYSDLDLVIVVEERDYEA
jgi:UTP:GlnB (protein PII) uridylyltransferase